MPRIAGCARHVRQVALVVLGILMIAWVSPVPATAQVTFTQLTNTTGGDAYSYSQPSISADGTRITFVSNLNLTGGNLDGNYELFLWTQGMGVTQLTNTTGGGSGGPSISANGTRIAFSSTNNLTGGNLDGNYELFLWTQGVGVTQLTNTTGGGSFQPSISADGTRIAFRSDRNLTGGNPDGNIEIFLWTSGSGITQLTNCTVWNNRAPSINSDGTRIVFESNCDLTPGSPGNADGNTEIFLWTSSSGLTQLTNTTGGDNEEPSISADGTWIVFESNCDLTPGSPGNADGNLEIFLWTQGVGFTQLTNTTGGGNYYPSISANGTRIAFTSTRDLTGGNPDGNEELFLWTSPSTIAQITTTTGGGNFEPSISANGTRIAFYSAHDLIPGSPGNADGNLEIFVATLTAPPTPDIKANGADGPLAIPAGANLTVTVALDPGGQAGVNADWWVAATSPFGLYWYTLNQGWVRSDAPIRVYGGPLFALAPYTVLNTTGLPVGNYTLYFGVDLLMNGALDWGQLHVDSVGVTIQ